jgi:hypothetical protein
MDGSPIGLFSFAGSGVNLRNCSFGRWAKMSQALSWAWGYL